MSAVSGFICGRGHECICTLVSVMDTCVQGKFSTVNKCWFFSDECWLERCLPSLRADGAQNYVTYVLNKVYWVMKYFTVWIFTLPEVNNHGWHRKYDGTTITSTMFAIICISAFCQMIMRSGYNVKKTSGVWKGTEMWAKICSFACSSKIMLSMIAQQFHRARFKPLTLIKCPQF